MAEEIRHPDCPPGTAYLLNPPWSWLGVDDAEPTVITEAVIRAAIERIEREGR